MTDIATRTDTAAIDTAPAGDSALARLTEWAQAARAAHQMATSLVKTSFVPQQYRGKPDEAAAAIMAGIEMGLGPMAALRAFDPIGGTPAPKAITLRAIVQGQGHDVRIVHSDDRRAEVAVRRRSDRDWQVCVWTIERAELAGLPGKNPNWKSNPTAMLVARATAEGCRWIASDAIMGMPYTVEELQDHPEMAAPPATRRLTAADVLGQTPADPGGEVVHDATDWPEVAQPGGDDE